VARTCGLIIIVLDASKPVTHKRIIERELEGFGIRLNKEPPNIEFKKRDKGGVSITRSAECDLTDETINSILHEYKIHHVDLHIKCNASMDDLIDIIEGNRKYIPCLCINIFLHNYL